MSAIYYWSPGDNSNLGSLGSDDHYLRLGAYQVALEPKEAEIEVEGVPQGIFFYTSGKYSLKSTDALHIAVEGPVVRRVKTGNLTYTNDTGDVAITTEEGGIEITAEKAITITAAQNTTDDSFATIEIDAGDKDVYYIQGKYNKTVDKYQEKMIKADNHKTVIGLSITAQSGLSLTHSNTVEMGYATFSTGLTLVEISTKGVSAGFENFKNSYTATTAVSFLLLDQKKDFLDEEFCFVKNEIRTVRFERGLAHARQNFVKTFQELVGTDDQAVIARYKAMGIVL